MAKKESFEFLGYLYEKNKNKYFIHSQTHPLLVKGWVNKKEITPEEYYNAKSSRNAEKVRLNAFMLCSQIRTATRQAEKYSKELTESFTHNGYTYEKIKYPELSYNDGYGYVKKRYNPQILSYAVHQITEQEYNEAKLAHDKDKWFKEITSRFALELDKKWSESLNKAKEENRKPFDEIIRTTYPISLITTSMDQYSRRIDFPNCHQARSFIDGKKFSKIVLECDPTSIDESELMLLLKVIKNCTK